MYIKIGKDAVLKRKKNIINNKKTSIKILTIAIVHFLTFDEFNRISTITTLIKNSTNPRKEISYKIINYSNQ